MIRITGIGLEHHRDDFMMTGVETIPEDCGIWERMDYDDCRIAYD